jgi:hypothetical protein
MKYFSYVRWLVPVALLGYIGWQSFLSMLPLVASTDFFERTPYFDVLQPAGRVTRMSQGIVLNQEPVYIDVRLPVRASQISLDLSVTDSSVPIKLGWQTDDNFVFDFSQSPPTNEAGLFVYHYELDDINYVRPGHKGRSIISAPSLVTGSVTVKRATVVINRKPADFAWWHRLITQAL